MVKRLEKLFAWGLLIIFAGIIIHTPLSVWLSTQFPGYEAFIKSWKEILMLLLVPLAGWLVTKRRLWQEFANDWLFRLIIVYAVLHFAITVFSSQGFMQSLAGIGIDLRYVLFFALVYTLIRIVPKYKVAMLKIVVGGAVVVLGFASLQMFLPADILSHIGYSDQTIKPYQTVDENPDYIRVNSTLRGPNPLGAYAAAALALIVAFLLAQRHVKDKKRSIFPAVLLLIGTVALWLSYSRSSIVAAIIGICVVIFLAGSKIISSRAWIVMSIAILLAGAGLFMLRDSGFVQNVILHDDPSTGGPATSNEHHVSSLERGLSTLLQQPLGSGVGSTGSASLHGSEGIIIENQYLFVAHEAGWLGLILFIAIFVVLMWRLLQLRHSWLAQGVFASGIALALIGLLLPVWADDTVSIVWWGLAAIAIGEKHGKKRTSK